MLLNDNWLVCKSKLQEFACPTPRKDNEILVSQTEQLSLFFMLQKYSNHQNIQLKVPYINILFLFLFRIDLLKSREGKGGENYPRGFYFLGFGRVERIVKGVTN